MNNLTESVKQRAAALKLVVFDVDGVMTDGRLYFSTAGEELKVFNSLDGHGIKSLRRSGVEVAIITGRDTMAVARRAAELGVEHLYQGFEEKLPVARQLLDKLGLRFEQVGYMGDDLPDLPVMKQVGLTLAPANAHWQIKREVDWLSQYYGGEGAVREACDMIMVAQGTLESS